jgi:hypothetical protein
MASVDFVMVAVTMNNDGTLLQEDLLNLSCRDGSRTKQGSRVEMCDDKTSKLTTSQSSQLVT